MQASIDDRKEVSSLGLFGVASLPSHSFRKVGLDKVSDLLTWQNELPFNGEHHPHHPQILSCGAFCKSVFQA